MFATIKGTLLKKMLARRFTLLCLVMTGFAYGLISLIQQSTRPAYSWRVETSIPCVFEDNRRCAVPLAETK
ncbi:MAG: hypothetical protein AAFP99_09235, partial [Pseudomonadota bacterium]